jgi:hypothetical protein
MGRKIVIGPEERVTLEEIEIFRLWPLSYPENKRKEIRTSYFVWQ